MFIISNLILMLTRLVDIVFNLYIIALIVRVALSWIRYDPNSQISRFLHQITEPLLTPIRRYVPPIGGIDFSTMILLVILYLLQGFIVATLRGFALQIA